MSKMLHKLAYHLLRNIFKLLLLSCVEFHEIKQYLRNRQNNDTQNKLVIDLNLKVNNQELLPIWVLERTWQNMTISTSSKGSHCMIHFH